MAYVTTTNFIGNDFVKLGSELQEHFVKELVGKLYQTWEMMDKTNFQ